MDKFVINRNKPNEAVKKTIENAINNEKESKFRGYHYKNIDGFK